MNVQVHICTYMTKTAIINHLVTSVFHIHIMKFLTLMLFTYPVADPGGFHWFPRKPPFKSEDYFNAYIYAAIKNILKNILCTVTQPFLIN